MLYQYLLACCINIILIFSVPLFSTAQNPFLPDFMVALYHANLCATTDFDRISTFSNKRFNGNFFLFYLKAVTDIYFNSGLLSHNCTGQKISNLDFKQFQSLTENCSNSENCS